VKAVEAVIRLFDPAYNMRAISVRRRVTGNRWYKRGECFRHALEVLWDAIVDVADQPRQLLTFLHGTSAGDGNQSAVWSIDGFGACPLGQPRRLIFQSVDSIDALTLSRTFNCSENSMTARRGNFVPRLNRPERRCNQVMTSLDAEGGKAMRYFAYIAEQSFKTAPSGERLFFPYGPWSRPYVLPDADT
jgi:hypothetical protein